MEILHWNASRDLGAGFGVGFGGGSGAPPLAWQACVLFYSYLVWARVRQAREL